MKRSAVAYKNLRKAVYRRSRGACERCYVGIPEDSFQCHHRRMRSQLGRDEFVNCVALCDRCHGHIHARPSESYREGWLVPSHAEPADCPLWRFGSWERLTETGWQQAKSAPRPEAS